MSRARAAAAGYRFLSAQNHRVRIRIADVPNGTVVINANPEDKEVVHTLYSPQVLDAVLDKASRGLVLTSAFTTAFEGLTIAGLAAGKGPAAATTELLDRVLPDTPERTLALATQLRDQVRSNLEKTKQINRRRRSSGDRPATQRSSATPATQRSSATPATQRNGNDNNGNGSNGNNGNGNNGFDDIDFWGM